MSHRLLGDFAEIASDWFWEMDENLRFSYFSQRFERVVGTPLQEEIGKSRLDIATNADDRAFWQEHIDDLLARRPFRGLVYPYKHRDGRVRWFKISGQPHFGPGGEFLGYRGVGSDITVEYEAGRKLATALENLRRANDQLQTQNLRFDAALRNMSHGLCMWDATFCIIVCNARFLEIYGFSPEVVKPGATLREVMEHSVAIGNHPGRTAEELYESYLADLAAQGSLTFERTLGNGRVIAIAHRPVADGSWVALYEDITERKRQFRTLQEREEELRVQNIRFDAALNNMSHGLCMFDAHERIIVCNEAYRQTYDLPSHVARPGTTFRQVVDHWLAARSQPPELAEQYCAKHRAVLAPGKPVSLTQMLTDGRTIAVSHRPMPGGGWVSIHQDVTERRLAEKRIAHMARHDVLTDLPNRLLFREHLEQELPRARRGESLAVLCLDLDQFKGVNDTLGHPTGDALLRAVADRLRGCVRDTDVIARFGGDEFAVIQVGIAQPAAATALAARLVDILSTPYDLDGHQVVIGASIGIAVAPQDGDDPDQLLKNADMALYRAKGDGRGTYRFFEPAMDARMQERRALELDLRKALSQGEFELFYQPLVHLGANEVIGFEALLRWHHPERGIVSPTDFIPLAEEIGLIVPLGEWVLRQACREAVGWPYGLKVAVNFSPAQFKSRTLLQTVVLALGASGLAPSRLEVEITESVLLKDNEETLAILHELKRLGVRISMDDFGTGYSSLSYLRSFPFDKIKIDRSFVRDIVSKEDSRAIVRAVTGIGSSLGMFTTAEGVETWEQLEQLRAEGCTEVQGFLFSPARPAGDLPALLDQLRERIRAAA